MNRKRAITIAIAAVLVITACSGDDTSEAPTTPARVEETTPPTDSTTTTTVEETTPTVAASTTTVLTLPPTTTTVPSPVTTIAGHPDWLAIVTGLSDKINEIMVNPQPERLGEVAVEGGDWASGPGSAIGNMAERGERVIGLEPNVVVSVEFVDKFDDRPIEDTTSVIVKVTTEAPDLVEAQIIDSNGDVVFDLVDDSEPGELSTAHWILGRTDDGWRILSIEAA